MPMMTCQNACHMLFSLTLTQILHMTCSYYQMYKMIITPGLLVCSLTVGNQTDNGQSPSVTMNLQKLLYWGTFRNVPMDLTVPTGPCPLQSAT